MHSGTTKEYTINMIHKYVGFNDHRLNPTDECCLPEITFVEQFNKDLERDPSIIKSIINHKDKGFKLTERDIKVAMSMMQWFGTNCGREFHERSTNAYKKKLAAIEQVRDVMRKTKSTIYQAVIDARKDFPDVDIFIQTS